MVDSMISTNCFVETDYSSDKDSGWSFYLEHDEADSFLSGSSMVSDAACCSAPKKHKRIDCDHHISSVGVSLTTSCERRTHKRRKTTVDHDLEDTACSSGESNSSDQMELVGKERNCTELGRKGLCLVPVSMLFNCVS